MPSGRCRPRLSISSVVSLIAAQRNFQANAKAIETANQMDQSIINMRS